MLGIYQPHRPSTLSMHAVSLKGCKLAIVGAPVLEKDDGIFITAQVAFEAGIN